MVRNKFLQKVLPALLLFVTVAAISTPASASTTWKHLDMNSLGTYTKMKVLKYNSSNWGDYLDYQHDLFKDTKHVEYRYSKRTRTLIMRYRNPEQFYLKTKFNYRKLIYCHGHKNPIVTHYFKVGHDKWKFATTIHYWLKKPIRY